MKTCFAFVMTLILSTGAFAQHSSKAVPNMKGAPLTSPDPPAPPLGSIQGNNGGVLGGVPGSFIDFTTGLITLNPPGPGAPLTLYGDAAGDDVVDIFSHGWNNNGALFIQSDGVPSSQGASAATMYSSFDDNAGTGNLSIALSLASQLTGSDLTNDYATGESIVVDSRFANSSPQQLSGLILTTFTNPAALPKSIVGIQVQDIVNPGGEATAVQTGKGLVKLGDLMSLAPFTISGGSNPLPPASAENAGQVASVSDSTVIASEGQTCVHTTVSPRVALAFSNGLRWKCL